VAGTSGARGRVNEIGLSEEDRLIFVRPYTGEDRDEGLLRRVRMTEEAIGFAFKDKDYVIIDIDENDPYGSILRILDEVDRGGETYLGDIIVLIAGGTRTQVSILTIYSQIDPRVKKLYSYSENISRFIEIPIHNTLTTTDKRNLKNQLDLLKKIRSNNLDTNLSKNKLTKLQKQGFIMKLPGRGGKYRSTPLAWVYQRLLEISLKLRGEITRDARSKNN